MQLPTYAKFKMAVRTAEKNNQRTINIHGFLVNIPTGYLSEEVLRSMWESLQTHPSKALRDEVSKTGLYHHGEISLTDPY